MPNIVAQSNLGLKFCKCDIVAMTNDDAEPFPDWLERMEPYYEDSTVGGVGGRDFVYEDGRLWQGQADRVGEIVWFGRHYGNHSLSYPHVRDVHLLKGVNMSCRRDLLQPLDTRMVPGGRWHWEIDMCFQIRRQGKRLVFDPNIRVDHFHGPRPGVLDPGFVYAANHNLTLNLVKHLYPAQRLIFLVYTFLWGSYPEMGLAVFGKTYLGRLLGHRDWGFALLLGISFKAKIDALRALTRGGDLDR
jgi:GT2 family glycosyltransferase